MRSNGFPRQEFCCRRTTWARQTLFVGSQAIPLPHMIQWITDIKRQMGNAITLHPAIYV